MSSSRFLRDIVKHPEQPVMHSSPPRQSSAPESPQSDYGSLTTGQVLDRLYSIKQGNRTTLSYFHEFQNLVLAAYAKPLDQLPDNQTSQRLLQVFIDGLNIKLKEIVKSYNCTNVFHVRRIALHEELYFAFNDAVKNHKPDDRLHKVEIVTMLQHESIKNIDGRLSLQNKDWMEMKTLLRSINDRLVKEDAEKVSERHSLVTEIREGMTGLRDKLMSDFSAGLEHRFECSLKHTLKEGLNGMLEDIIDDVLEKKLEEKLEAKLESKLDSMLESKLDAMLESKLESKLEEKLTEKLHRFTKLEIPGMDEKFEEVQHVLDHNYECTRWTFNAMASMKEVSRHYRNKSPLNLKALKSDLKVSKNWERKEKERERSPEPRERRERKREHETEREESNITPPVKLPNLAWAASSPRPHVQRFDENRSRHVHTADPMPVPPPKSIPNRILPAQTKRHSMPAVTTSVQVNHPPPSPIGLSAAVTDEHQPARPKGKFVPAQMFLVQDAPLVPPAPPGIKTSHPVAPARIKLPPLASTSAEPLGAITVQISRSSPPPPHALPKTTPSYPVPLPAESTVGSVSAQYVDTFQDASSVPATLPGISSESFVCPPNSTTPPLAVVPPESSSKLSHVTKDTVQATPVVQAAPTENESSAHSDEPENLKKIQIKLEPMDDGYEQIKDVYSERVNNDPVYRQVYDILLDQNVSVDLLIQAFHTDEDPLTQVEAILERQEHRINEARKCLAEESHRKNQPCWFCTSREHHSFYCLRVPSIEKRKEILANRPCQHCYKHHHGKCLVPLECHFCFNKGERDESKLNHHMVICPIHEEYATNIDIRKVFRQIKSLLMERIN